MPVHNRRISGCVLSVLLLLALLASSRPVQLAVAAAELVYEPEGAVEAAAVASTPQTGNSSEQQPVAPVNSSDSTGSPVKQGSPESPEAAAANSTTTSAANSTTGAAGFPSGGCDDSLLAALAAAPPGPLWPPPAAKAGLACTMELTWLPLAAASRGAGTSSNSSSSSSMCGVMRLQNNIQSGVSGWQVVGSFRAGDALLPQGAVGAQLVGGSSGSSRQPFRLVATDGSPQLGPKGGVTHLLLQAGVAPPTASPPAAQPKEPVAAAASGDAAAGGGDDEGELQLEAGELHGSGAGSTTELPQYMVIEVSPALTSVYVNGLECTRLPWDILGGTEGATGAAAAGTTGGPPECQASDWGLGPNGWLGDPASDALVDTGDMAGDLVSSGPDGSSMAGSRSSRAGGRGGSRQGGSFWGWGTSWGGSSGDLGGAQPGGGNGSGSGGSPFSSPNSSSDLLAWLRGPAAYPTTSNTTSSSSSTSSSRSVSPSAAARAEAWAALLQASPWAQLGAWHGGDPTAAASRLLSCLSHYCCGLQVVDPPPGSSNSSSNGSSSSNSSEVEAPVRAASGQRELPSTPGQVLSPGGSFAALQQQLLGTLGLDPTPDGGAAGGGNTSTPATSSTTTLISRQGVNTSDAGPTTATAAGGGGGSSNTRLALAIAVPVGLLVLVAVAAVGLVVGRGVAAHRARLRQQQQGAGGSSGSSGGLRALLWRRRGSGAGVAASGAGDGALAGGGREKETAVKQGGGKDSSITADTPAATLAAVAVARSSSSGASLGGATTQLHHQQLGSGASTTWGRQGSSSSSVDTSVNSRSSSVGAGGPHSAPANLLPAPGWSGAAPEQRLFRSSSSPPTSTTTPAAGSGAGAAATAVGQPQHLALHISPTLLTTNSTSSSRQRTLAGSGGSGGILPQPPATAQHLQRYSSSASTSSHPRLSRAMSTPPLTLHRTNSSLHQPPAPKEGSGTPPALQRVNTLSTGAAGLPRSPPLAAAAAGTTPATPAKLAPTGPPAGPKGLTWVRHPRHLVTVAAGDASHPHGPGGDGASSSAASWDSAAVAWQQLAGEWAALEEARGWLTIDFAAEVTLSRKLGEGGFGSVFAGRWRGEAIAVKLVPVMNLLGAGATPSHPHPHPHHPLLLTGAGEGMSAAAGGGTGVPHQQQLVTLAAATGSSLRAVLREISTLAGLTHPHIVAFKGACLAPPHIAILEELAVGGSLHDALYGPPRRAGVRRSGSSRGRRGKARPSPSPSPAGGVKAGGGGGRLGTVALLQVAADVAAAMAYLHPRVVHRDLKPQNVLLDGQGRAKVCDFGISKMKDATAASTTRAAPGTPAYMAPEAFEGRPLSEAVDVWAWGVLVWECCAGVPPWGGLSAMQIIYAVGLQKERLPRPAGVSDALWALLTSCWEEDPAARPSFPELLPMVTRLLEEAAGEQQQLVEQQQQEGDGVAAAAAVVEAGVQGQGVPQVVA